MRVGGACGPSYPDSFWWSEGPPEKPGSCGRGQPVQPAPEEADGVSAAAVCGYLTGTNGSLAEQHAAPDRQHDCQEQSLRALGLQHATELPFERATLGIPKQGFDVHPPGVQVG